MCSLTGAAEVATKLEEEQEDVRLQYDATHLQLGFTKSNGENGGGAGIAFCY